MGTNVIASLQEQIADNLRSDIISGALQTGQRLREGELAEKFGVSRGPIRDVLLQLTKEGLLVSKRNCGVTVNEHLSPTLQSLMIDLRVNIESHAVRQLKGKLTEDDYDAMENILSDLQAELEKENFTEATEADLAFHRYIVRKAGGEDLLNIWTPIVLRMRMDYKRISTPQQSTGEHIDILEALRRQDMRAAVKALKANIR